MVDLVRKDPNIYRIRIELPRNPLKNLNIYVLQTPGRSLVIDTGFNNPECHEALWAGISELNLDLSSTALFLTHFHADHIGLVWDFVERGVPVYMGKREYEYSKKINAENIVGGMNVTFTQEGFPGGLQMRHIGESKGRLEIPRPGFPVNVIEDGDDLPMGDLKVQTICTPGHTPGHTVLYLPKQQLLFTGDHILFDITPNISIWPSVPHSLADYLASLKMARKIPVRASFPAHREAGEDFYQRIDQLLEHHRCRLDEIQQTVIDHPGITAYETAGLIHWSLRGLSWEMFPYNQRWFAMAETLAHLYYLVDAQRIVRDESGEFVRYYCWQ